MEEPRKHSPASAALAALRRDQAHAYEGADQHNAVRLVALLWSLSALLALAFFPIDHPDAQIGAAGWAVAAAIVAVGFVGAARLAKRQLGFDALLALSYTGLLQIMLLVWLAGGTGSQYSLLYLFWVCSAMGVHPPHRAFAFLGATALAAAAPLLYGDSTAHASADIVASVLLWAAIGIVMLTLMVTVRGQRVQLRQDELRERQLARADTLTGLGNRRAFDEALEHEVARSARAGSRVSIVLLDVDGLKAINDGFGHVEGDRCLVSVAGTIVGAVRAGDRAFRWGGDEFTILLPDTDYAGAEKAAASICDAVARACSDCEGRPLSVSAGIAEVDGEMTSEDLVERADMELLARKRTRLSIAG